MIYVLEDDANIRKLVDYALTREGYSVEGFGTPAEFWAAVGRQIPQLVLLDIMLPQEDGLSVLQKLRSRSDTRIRAVLRRTGPETEEKSGGSAACMSSPDGILSRPAVWMWR